MKNLLIQILEKLEFEKDFIMLFPDGTEYRYGSDEPDFVIHFKTENALTRTMLGGSLGFGEAYMAQELDIKGDLQDVCMLGFRILDGHLKPSLKEKARFLLGYLSRRNTINGSKRNIQAHYDLGNDFYALWLDHEMQYTCAYFQNPSDTLEKAQLQKLDLVCRKLRLQPGETVIEAGCGWGGLALHAARKYGVKIRSFNISREQIEYARDRARRLGISSDRIEYVEDDYRNILNGRSVYDKFVSIGMLEHVGLENYKDLYKIIETVTRPRGLALVHSISRIAPFLSDPWLEKYIFPGCYIPSLAEMITPVESRSRPLHVVDVENLRYHYALTLDHWHKRFEKNLDLISSKYNESFVRMFRLYLRASAAGFRAGGVLLYQILLSNGYDDSAPLTRNHFFEQEKYKSVRTIAKKRISRRQVRASR